MIPASNSRYKSHYHPSLTRTEYTAHPNEKHSSNSFSNQSLANPRTIGQSGQTTTFFSRYTSAFIRDNLSRLGITWITEKLKTKEVKPVSSSSNKRHGSHWKKFLYSGIQKWSPHSTISTYKAGRAEMSTAHSSSNSTWTAEYNFKH